MYVVITCQSTSNSSINRAWWQSLEDLRVFWHRQVMTWDLGSLNSPKQTNGSGLQQSTQVEQKIVFGLWLVGLQGVDGFNMWKQFFLKWNQTLSKTELHYQAFLLFQSTSDVFDWDVRKSFTDYLCVHQYMLSYTLTHDILWDMMSFFTTYRFRFTFPSACRRSAARLWLHQCQERSEQTWLMGVLNSRLIEWKYLTLNSSYFRKHTPRNAGASRSLLVDSYGLVGHFWGAFFPKAKPRIPSGCPSPEILAGNS